MARCISVLLLKPRQLVPSEPSSRGLMMAATTFSRMSTSQHFCYVLWKMLVLIRNLGCTKWWSQLSKVITTLSIPHTNSLYSIGITRQWLGWRHEDCQIKYVRVHPAPWPAFGSYPNFGPGHRPPYSVTELATSLRRALETVASNCTWFTSWEPWPKQSIQSEPQLVWNSPSRLGISCILYQECSLLHASMHTNCESDDGD